MCCMQLAENTEHKNSSSAHHHTTLSAYIFATKACIDNRKNLLNSNISSTSPHNMVNFGPLRAEISWRVGAPQQISTGFASWLRYFHDLINTIQQRAPRTFGWAAHILVCLYVCLSVTLSSKSTKFGSRYLVHHLADRDDIWHDDGSGSVAGLNATNSLQVSFPVNQFYVVVCGHYFKVIPRNHYHKLIFTQITLLVQLSFFIIW